MSDLADLALRRANLPHFAGATLADQLWAGRQAAAMAIRKYAPSLAFDERVAAETIHGVDGWLERSGDVLSTVLADQRVTALPEAVRLAFGSDRARAFVVATFTQAAAGLGPYMSGAIDRVAETGATIAGQVVTPRWVEEDAQTRLAVFGAIVQMDQDGYLAQLWVPPPGAAPVALAGPEVVFLGMTAWQIIVVAVAMAALLAWLSLSMRQIGLANDVMRETCRRAQLLNRDADVKACFDALADLQRNDITHLLGKAISAAAGVGIAYVGVRYGLPILVEALERHGSRRARA